MTDVVMPKLGETVTEGTITKWLKQPGERVERDETLFEVSTDKVDTEVPAPSSGVLVEILVAEGETVPVGTRLAVIDERAPDAGQPVRDEPVRDEDAPARAADEPDTQAGETAPEASHVPVEPSTTTEPTVLSESRPPARDLLASPLVRRIAREYGIDLSTVRGSGPGGRITRADVERVARSSPPPRTTSRAATARTGEARALQAADARSSRPLRMAEEAVAAPGEASRTRRVPMSRIRRLTGERMSASWTVAPHAVTSVEVDYEAVERVRRAHKDEFRAREGVPLTYLPFVARAVIDALADFPHVNATVAEGELVVYDYVNLAVAVDLDFEGLVAPVIRDAQDMRLAAIARSIHDLARRARERKLSVDDITGGTFTITNAGSYGTHMIIPIIDQPQVAILSTDGVGRKPVVVTADDGTEAVAIRSVGLLTMSWDHRAFDGAYSAAFLARVREILEGRDWEGELW
ncbi:MAG: dihydrolipoamide acetyltransferase component of pyruvate dehydrogenase complex [Acidimicrobiales bacterium]|nr:MAG: dihydrolipoamide acetyltransferase component of pyruvate dehydrogenase complex [Acidimicrobiales bacterium]